MAVRFLGNAGTVFRFLAGPGLGPQDGSHGPLPHTAGQIVGQLLRYLAAFLRDGVAVVLQSDKALPGNIVQTGADLKVIDQRFLHQGVFDLRPGNGPGILDQIAQQQPDLGAVRQPAGTYSGSKSIVGGHRSHISSGFIFYSTLV